MRKKVNHIISLEAADATRVTDETSMRHLACKYFEELFQSHHSLSSPVINSLHPVLDDVDADNLELTTPFQIHEFKEAMFSMHPDKCPDPNGFRIGFYHQFWNTCSHDIFQECFRLSNENQFPPTLNTRNITLILKGQQQRLMKDNRLISLCNVLY